jgi:hypothetical protein
MKKSLPREVTARWRIVLEYLSDGKGSGRRREMTEIADSMKFKPRCAMPDSSW